jgi:predicted DsbA family dithiol-disulfide isomerase
MTVIQVFADVGCPFAHVGLVRFVERREAAGRLDVRLHVRSWPLEIVNGRPMDPQFIAEEIDQIADQLATGLFDGFDTGAFPATSIPSLALAAAAYRSGIETGEAVSLELRRLCFRDGRDVADGSVLAETASRHEIAVTSDDVDQVHADLADGREMGVVGSPHFFTPDGDFFCPALDVGHDAAGHLRIAPDPAGFDRFLDACFSV